MRYRRFIIGIIITLLVTPAPLAWARPRHKPTSRVPAAQRAIDQAWTALDGELCIAQEDKAIRHFETAYRQDPVNTAVLLAMSEEYFRRGLLMPHGNKNEVKARNLFLATGYDYAKKAMKIRETAGAHCWMAANLGEMKHYSNKVQQAAILPKVNAHLDWVMEHEMEYRYGMVLRIWLGIAVRAPQKFTKILGEDPEEIFQLLGQMIGKEPRYLENYLIKAEYLWSKGLNNDALRTLELALTFDCNSYPELMAENRFIQKRAKMKWLKYTGQKYPDR